MAGEPLHVAIVEASPEIHVAIADLLESAADLRVVGHARSLPELERFDLQDFDVLVADLRACLGSDLVLSRLRGRYPGLRLVVTTMNSGREYEQAIASLSADGWVHKAHLANQLVSTLRRLAP